MSGAGSSTGKETGSLEGESKYLLEKPLTQEN